MKSHRTVVVLVQRMMKIVGTTWIILIFVCIAFLPAPYVTPFANAGPTSSSPSSSSSQTVTPQQLLRQQPPQQPHPSMSLTNNMVSSVSTSTSRRSHTVLLSNSELSAINNDNSSLSSSSSTPTEVPSTTTLLQKVRNQVSRIFRKSTPRTATTASTATVTYTKNTFLSRLFFNYVVPLLHLASVRQLTVEDALLFQNQNNYNKSVRDMGYHINFLIESMAVDSKILFLDYPLNFKIL